MKHFKLLILSFILFVLCCICIDNVYATRVSYWGDNIEKRFQSIYAYNWSTYPTSYVDLETQEVEYQVDDDYSSNPFYGIRTTNSVNTYTQGVSFAFDLDQALITNYLYSISLYVCNSNSTVYSMRSGISSSNNASNSLTNTPTYSRINVTRIDNHPFKFNELPSSALSSCAVVTALISPSTDGSWVSFRFLSPDVARNGYFYLLGYSFESLGIYDKSLKDDIADIIDDTVSGKGLATGSSVNEVKGKIDDIQDDIDTINSRINSLTSNITLQSVTNEINFDEVKSKQDTTNQELNSINDSITDSSAPSMGNLSSASGWLPSGPVDSLLTLPLSMLNNISTSLGQTCQPIDLTLPFVDYDFELPCINTLYSKISGLNTFLNSIATICGGFLLYYYFKNLYKYIDDILSLKDSSGWGDV